jgi:hypothetical protein
LEIVTRKLDVKSLLLDEEYEQRRGKGNLQSAIPSYLGLWKWSADFEAGMAMQLNTNSKNAVMSEI